MITKTVPLKFLTTLHQKGDVTVKYIEHEREISGDIVLIGGGSNILIKGANLVSKLSERFDYIYREGNLIRVGAATPLKKLIAFIVNNSLSCLEFLSGVPASVGGATIMNAGAFGYEISDFIDYVLIYDPLSKEKVVSKNIVFNYRNSSITGIILEVGIRCKRVEAETVKDRVVFYVKHRKKNAHLSNTFGSVFKNPSNDLPAGKLIESCGLKGAKKNTAMISPKHGNYIIGKGLVDVDDVLYLIDLAKNEVLKRFSIELEEEVRII